MDISIVIVSFNSGEFLARCLNSIPPACGALSWEIIVVDNASQDDSASIAEAKKSVKLIRNPENVGFGRACNQGAAAASGKWLVFFNSDAEAEHGAFDRMARYIEDHPNAGIIGPKMCDEKGALARSFFRFPTQTRPFLNYKPLRLMFGERFALTYPKAAARTAGPVDWVSGACILIPRTLFRELGMFDERFFMYFEDTDLCRRAWMRGFNVIYLPEARVMHRSGGSSRQSTFLYCQQQRSRLIYFATYHSTAGYWMQRVQMAAASLMYSIIWGITFRWDRFGRERKVMGLALFGYAEIKLSTTDLT